MIRCRTIILLPSVTLVVGFFFFSATFAEEECLSGRSYWCYECDSYSDSRCKDPFNWTAQPSELPAQKQCEGCCVKIVTNASKTNEKVRRTCTKDIDINLFMVDHVCMYEGHKIGHMCFCEGDQCNTGPSIKSSPMIMIVELVIVCLFTFRVRMTT
ncbi:UPAR/Ly6 domain-containing protein qvr-like [Parasteatoda tepidariorum]|uniref:UPAR/Ly6 domain-containing protein qvr-like n=1 Tax=Parasteatoda tepidariorum TaxID=114398 RepID=UPI00077FD691|nr:protein quiver-like [Parasteatoda tepidariorum]